MEIYFMKKLLYYIYIFFLLLPFIGCKKEEQPSTWYYNDSTHWRILHQEKIDEEPHDFIHQNGIKSCSICPYQINYTDEENYQEFLISKKNTLLYEGDYTYEHFYSSDEYQEKVIEMYSEQGLFFRNESIFEAYQDDYIEVSQNMDIMLYQNHTYIYLKITRFLNEKKEWEEMKKEENQDIFFIKSLKEYSPDLFLKTPEAIYIQGDNYEEYEKHLSQSVSNENLISFTPFSSWEKENTLLLGYKKREKTYKNVEEVFTLFSKEERIIKATYQSHYIVDQVASLGPTFSFTSSFNYSFNKEDYQQKIKPYS